MGNIVILVIVFYVIKNLIKAKQNNKNQTQRNGENIEQPQRNNVSGLDPSAKKMSPANVTTVGSSATLDDLFTEMHKAFSQKKASNDVESEQVHTAARKSVAEGDYLGYDGSRKEPSRMFEPSGSLGEPERREKLAWGSPEPIESASLGTLGRHGKLAWGSPEPIESVSLANLKSDKNAFSGSLGPYENASMSSFETYEGASLYAPEITDQSVEGECLTDHEHGGGLVSETQFASSIPVARSNLQNALIWSEILKKPKFGVAPRYR